MIQVVVGTGGTTATYSCDCPTGYWGNQCEFSPCDVDPGDSPRCTAGTKQQRFDRVLVQMKDHQNKQSCISYIDNVKFQPSTLKLVSKILAFS